ncbi:MAG TPA: glycosyl hydrolase family 28-related protein [Pseudobacteroides sp.]|uniref:glycosyl hydrolase family 28-related protein n=1 Tax=Pseudobacteroides sp. TaxID=1968840 RepID=UPI002F95672B
MSNGILKFVMCVILILAYMPINNVYSVDVYGNQIHWNPGVSGGIPDKPTEVSVKDFGAKGDGTTDDYSAFKSAIDSIKAGGAVVIPSGKYLIKSMLTINKPVVLKGEGTGKTELLVNHSSNAFEIITYKRGTWQNLEGGYSKGSTELIVDNASSITPGVYVEIQQTNDPEMMYTLTEWNQSWADGAVGQIAKVLSVKGNSITIDEPLRYNFKGDLNPVIRTQGFVENVGFEDFSIKRLDTGDANIFFFKNAANCWIRNIHSMLARKAHVSVTSGYRIEVRDSFFEDATDWAGGGHGYGVELGYHVTDCLVENNIFKHLRHSMMVHLGANGNVFGYNYSIEPHQNEGGNWTPCDISIHGHQPFANLFEGNIVQEISIADYWGPAGPDNTFLRNRIESEGISIEDSSNHQNIIGNEFVKSSIFIDTESRYPHKIDSSTLKVHGNYINGSVSWDSKISENNIPVSYYIKAKPAFFRSLEWPSTGADRVGGTNPARERYLGNTIPTITPAPTQTAISISGYIKADVQSDNKNLNSDFNVEVVGMQVTVNTDSNGYFNIKNLPVSLSGYTIKISKPGYLARTITNISGKSSTELGKSENPLKLWAGDVPVKGLQDNVINMIDVIEIAKHFNASYGDIHYSRECDFNLDNSINMSDILIIARNFNNTGSSYPAAL